VLFIRLLTNLKLVNKNQDYPNLLRDFKKYFYGENYEHEKGISENTIISQIHEMKRNHEVFSIFNNAIKESQEEENFRELFSSNRYLWNIILNDYFKSQALFIRRLTDKNEKSASLISILNKIQRNLHYDELNTKIFEIYKNSISKENLKYIEKLALDIKFTRMFSCQYIEDMKERLDSKEINEVRNYTDKYLAHADIAPKKVNLNINKIKNCHQVIIATFKSIYFLLFGADGSFLTKVSLNKIDVLKNANNPFLTNMPR